VNQTASDSISSVRKEADFSPYRYAPDAGMAQPVSQPLSRTSSHTGPAGLGDQKEQDKQREQQHDHQQKAVSSSSVLKANPSEGVAFFTAYEGTGSFERRQQFSSSGTTAGVTAASASVSASLRSN